MSTPETAARIVPAVSTFCGQPVCGRCGGCTCCCRCAPASRRRRTRSITVTATGGRDISDNEGK